MKITILPFALLIALSIYSFKLSDNSGDKSTQQNSLVIGNNVIPISISKNGIIEIQQLTVEEMILPVFEDTIITFDYTYYYDKLELTTQKGTTKQAVFSSDELSLNKESFLNTSAPISLITDSDIKLFVPIKFSATIIKESGESFSKGYDLTQASIKTDDKTAKKQEFVANELKWIFENSQSGDKVVIWKIRFEHEKKRYDFKQNIMISIQ